MKRMLCMLLAMGLVLCCVSGAMAQGYVILTELHEQSRVGWNETVQKSSKKFQKVQNRC